ncbi:MAG: DUF6607 family protein [Hyphomonas sp.]|jgi:hypothetical protein
MIATNRIVLSISVLAGVLLAACTTLPARSDVSNVISHPAATDLRDPQFQADREAILAMAGNYKVKFDFNETVAFDDDYFLKPRKVSGGDEVVLVVEDRGNFISLQHILVVGGEHKMAIKHWRQDWQYEPERVLIFIGGNAWEWRDVPASERAGTWSQTVYQVDDAPRYGAVATWSHENGIATWQPPHEWRPLPRRDMTTRDDYHAIHAMNRHVVTSWGWVHEQDNGKLVLSGSQPHMLARETGLNTYRRGSDFETEIATDYWSGTADFWAGVRGEWDRIASQNEAFAVTIKGETEALYMSLLTLAGEVADGSKGNEEAVLEARQLIENFTTSDIGALADRLRPTDMDIAETD